MSGKRDFYYILMSPQMRGNKKASNQNPKCNAESTN